MGRLAGALVVVAVALCAAAPQAAAQECADEGGVGYVCGVNNPEDLLAVDGTPFVLVGDMGKEDEDGGFNAVHVATRAVRPIEPTFPPAASDAYPGCPGP